MPELKIVSAGITSVVDVPRGTRLLDALRSAGFEVYSPCGGNGKCGKCKVYLRDEGYVTSCLYPVNYNIEIVLPEPSEARILAAQYKHSRMPELSPGDAAGLSRNPFGVAVDIGTTTLVFHLIRLTTGSLLETRTAMNPQSAFGADVISRINYCILNPEGLTTLQSAIINTINSELGHFALKTGIDQDDIVKICVSGNTTMLHILLGVNPEPIAFVPFTPVFTGEKKLKGSALNLRCNPEGELKILPSFSAYIGADIVAGIASLEPVDVHRNFLFIGRATVRRSG